MASLPWCDGLLADDGLHRVAADADESTEPVPLNWHLHPPGDNGLDEMHGDDGNLDEPVLTSEELRALLQE